MTQATTQPVSTAWPEDVSVEPTGLDGIDWSGVVKAHRSYFGSYPVAGNPRRSRGPPAEADQS